MQNQSLIHGLSFNNRNKLVWTVWSTAAICSRSIRPERRELDFSWRRCQAVCSQRKDIAIKWYAKSQTISVNGDDRADVEDRLNSVASMAKSLSDVTNSEEEMEDRTLETTLGALNNKLQTLKEELVLKCLPLQIYY